VILQVFADESDTCNGGPTPTICGFIQTRDYWIKFDKKWRRVLDDYAAPYFHFREFADRKNQSVIESSPYRTWSEKQKDSFLYDLAILCAEAAVPVVASYDAKRHWEKALPSNPYENVIELFYETLIRELNKQWPNHNGELVLVFDSSDNEDWLAPLNKTHKRYQELNPRIVGSITFADDKSVRPLQAADLFAYAVRQHAERWMTNRAEGDGAQPPMRLLDFILRKNLTKGAKDSDFRRFERIFRMILADQRQKKKQWKREGNAKKQYYPAEHFPHLFTYPNEHEQ
jgi:hypothetical protein